MRYKIRYVYAGPWSFNDRQWLRTFWFMFFSQVAFEYFRRY